MPDCKDRLYYFSRTSLILACGILTFFFATGDSGSWSSLIENVSEDNYVSPERSHNAKLTVYYYTDDEYYNKEKSNSYGFTVNVCDLAVINAGPIVFDSNYRSIQSKDLFEEQPNISVKWIDDDTIEINGQKFNVNR